MSEQKPQSGAEPNQPYSASKHAIQGAGENVHEAKEAINKATASLSNLVSGKGNMVDAAVAVKGAIDNVTGLTNRLSATAMMPVMKALSAFKGQAILPAGKQMDPVMGIDVHMVTIPPSPAPIPMPHPYIGILFNPKDWVSCLINTFKKDLLDKVPAPAEGDTSNMASIAKNKDAIAGIAMGLAGMSASVKFGGFVPRAVTGTKVKNIPHIPMGAGFHPAFVAAVAKNHGKAFLGSLFVAADGDPMVGSFHLNYDCWDIGIVDLFKSQRAGGKKAPEPGGPQAELYVPSGTVLPIPWGRPVLVNSIPTPINPMAILDRLFKAGLGKLKAAGRKAVQKQLDKLNGKVGCGPLTAVSKAIGTGQSHPVDVSGGYFYTDNVDFSLPGPIPLSWERTWYSNSNYKGPLGYGWHHSYDMALAIDQETSSAILRMQDGRVATFELPVDSKGVFNRSEKQFLHLHEEGYYYTTNNEGLIYRFTQKVYKNPHENTVTHLLQSISNRNGFAIRFAYNDRCSLTEIIDSASRILKVNNDSFGRIVSIHAPDPTFGGRTTFPITRYTYSEEGDMVKQTDALDQPMLFEYANHLMIREIWRNGLTWHFRYNRGAGIDAKCVEVWGDGNLLHYTFDYTNPGCTVVTNSLGYKKLFYHKNGVVIKYIDPNEAAWHYRYNKFNELEWKSDPLGNQHSYSYDYWGNLVNITRPDGCFSQTAYNHPKYHFLPTGAVDARGGEWQWKYNQSGNTIEKINPLGAKTIFRYEDGLLREVQEANDAIVSIEYDSYHNPSKIIRPNGATNLYAYNSLGTCKEITNPFGLKQHRQHDLLQRVINLSDFDRNTILLRYDEIGNLIQYKDNNKNIQYSYGDLWKVKSCTEDGFSIRFIYDAEEQLCRIINEQSLSFTFNYDPAGNIIARTGFDGLKRRYERNAAGWITKVHRPGSKQTKYSYNEAGRVTEVQHTDGSIDIYTYDKGNLISAANNQIDIAFERDILGRITKETSGTNWISNCFDYSGNRLATKSSLGADVKNTYDIMDDLIYQQVGDWECALTRDLLSNEILRLLPGEITCNWQRDKLGRPEVHSVNFSKRPNSPTSLHQKYSWKENDILKQIIDDRTGVISFERDDRGNLSKMISSEVEQYRNPDAVGNLYETKARKDRKYDKGGKLLESKSATYEYDDEGNMIEKRLRNGNVYKYEWNAAGMLSKVVTPDKNEVTFKYDVFGRRIEKKYKNTITKFLWDGNKLLHEWKEFDVRETNVDDLITWIIDQTTYSPVAKIKGSKYFSIINDHIGTPIQAYNQEGELIWSRQLDSYGNIQMFKGDEGFCNYLYQGQIMDKETGLAYNRHRYYSPEEGLYISQDPIGIAGGLQLYGYVHDTTGWIDPLGLAKDPGKPPHSPDEKKWADKGGTIDKDGGAGNWKYTDKDGNTVPYVNGHPDFENGTNAQGEKVFVKQKVPITGMQGDHYHDPKKAEEAGKPKGENSTWHHHEDKVHMLEVDEDIHARFTHKGGVSYSKK